MCRGFCSLCRRIFLAWLDLLVGGDECLQVALLEPGNDRPWRLSENVETFAFPLLDDNNGDTGHALKLTLTLSCASVPGITDIVEKFLCDFLAVSPCDLVDVDREVGGTR